MATLRKLEEVISDIMDFCVLNTLYFYNKEEVDPIDGLETRYYLEYGFMTNDESNLYFKSDNGLIVKKCKFYYDPSFFGYDISIHCRGQQSNETQYTDGDRIPEHEVSSLIDQLECVIGFLDKKYPGYW